MKQMSKGSIITLLLLGLIFPSINYATASIGCTNAISFFYINGVSIFADKNRFNDAKGIANVLKKNGLITTETVAPLRNPSEGIFVDIFIELANQKLAEKSSATYGQAISDTAQLMSGDSTYAASDADKALTKAKMVDFFNRTQNLPTTNMATSEMTGIVTNALVNGDKTIVIAHSQGNMFANAVLNSVVINQSSAIAAGLKVVSIATPAASAQDNRYKTAFQDIVINIAAKAEAFAIGAPLPLVSNIDISGALAFDWKGHGLFEVYLNEALNAINSIMLMVQDAVASANPQQCKPVVAICPLVFTADQLAKVTPNMTVPEVDQVFGCDHRGGTSGSNWVLWFNDAAFTDLSVDMASVYFTNGIYLGNQPRDKYLTGPTHP